MESTQLSLPERVRTALSSPDVEAEFRALAASSAEILAITNPAGYEQCHAARMRLVKARTATAKRGKEVREDAQAFAKAVIAEEKRLIGIIEPEEERLQALQKAEDDKREAKIRAERERVEKILASIASINETALAVVGKTAGEIAQRIESLKAQDVSAWAAEYTEQAKEAQAAGLATLEQLHAGAVAAEKAAAEEAARIKAEREELDRLRAAEKLRAETEAKAQAEARAKLEAEEKAAREKREAEDRAAQAERDRLDAEAKAAREAEQKRLDEIAAAQRAAAAAEEARLKKERDEIEAREREARRLETELADGQTVLTVFKDRFGKRREFSGVVKAIDAYFATRKVAA